MQDEILKHTKKIYRTTKNKKHTFSEKLKEIIVEIFIIVFAVTLSIWLHSWSEHRHQQKEVIEFLEDLKVDLKSDIADLENQNSKLQEVTKNCSILKNLTKEKVDSLSANKMKLNLNPLSKIRNTGSYQGFLSSGKIGLIENRQLKSKILNYYQKTVPEKDDWQIYYNSLVFDLAKEITANNYETFLKEVYDSEKAKKILDNCESQGKQIVLINNNVVKNANEILVEIDKITKK